MRKISMALAALALLFAATAHAQSEPAARAAAVAPFVDEQTLAVVRVDRTHVDLAMMFAELQKLIALPAPLASAAAAEIEGPLGQLRQAGVRELYMVFSTAYLLHPPFVVAVPVEEGADAEAIAAVLRSGFDGVEQIRGAVCAGQEGVLQRLRSIKPVHRPELRAAFAAAGDSAVQVLIIPTADSRRVIEETLPLLPEDLGGGPSTAFTRGVMWAALGLSGPPESSLKLTIQSQDASAAENLGRALADLKEALSEAPGLRDFRPEYDRIAGELMPRVSGDRLVLSLDKAAADGLLRDILGPLFGRAREEAGITRSQANVHNILLACMMYRKDHQRDWPERLEAVAEKPWLRNPRRPDLEVGYAYRKPAKDDSARTVVIYEKYDQWPAPGIVVGFFDMAVTRVDSEERFKKMLASGR